MANMAGTGIGTFSDRGRDTFREEEAVRRTFRRQSATPHGAGRCDWRWISVAHEEGKLNNLRAVLGNDMVIKAYHDSDDPLTDYASRSSLATAILLKTSQQKGILLYPSPALIFQPASHLNTAAPSPMPYMRR